METVFTTIIFINRLMPTYTYFCFECNEKFEVFSHISEYKEQADCPSCKKHDMVNRLYCEDAKTQSASVKKSDSELKTIGDLALRNSDRMSDDYKEHLFKKHNAYRFEQSTKDLPSGMSRVKPKEKIQWPGTQSKQKRQPKKSKPK